MIQRKNESSFERLDMLVGALREGNLTSEESAELQELLKALPGAHRRFAEHMFLASALEAEMPVFSKEQTGPEKRARRAGNTFQFPLVDWRILIGAAAATVVLLLVLPAYKRSTHEAASEAATTTNVTEMLDHGVAVLTQIVGVRWQPDGGPLKLGASLRPGHLKLEAGVVRIEFYSGATVLLEGNADLEIVSRTEAILHQGKLRALVPSHARGFTIHSREVELVDRGTEFGLQVDALEGTQVHVFKGKVELFDPKSQRSPSSKRDLTEGAGLRVDRHLTRTDIPAAPAQFVSLRDVEERFSARLEQRSHQWREYSRQVQQNPQLIAYYSFEREPANDRALRNGSPAGEENLTGSVVGCSWADGRWPGKGALEFKRPADRVRLNVPGQYDSLTLTAWVRVDGLDNGFSSLILSDGWRRPGAVHWQITRAGELELAVYVNEQQDPNSRSKVVLSPYDLGRWLHLAVVYDSNKKLVTHYLDGVAVSRHILTQTMPLSIGAAQIGNWNILSHQDITPIRNFNGRMDELIILGEPLSGEEIQRLYEVGRPQT